MVDYLPKTILVPLDEDEAYTGCVEFVHALYPEKDRLTLILHYIEPPLAPVYKGTPSSPAMREKKKNLLAERREKTKAILDRARRRLVELGFSEELVQEHVQERELSVAHHACRLADMKKVDAVVVPKKITSKLEGFLKGNPTPDFLHHCLVSPIWFVEGRPSTERAVLAVGPENTSLRAVDHAGFMLAETKTLVDLVHVSSRVSGVISSGVETKSADYLRWESSSQNREARTFMDESVRILINAGFTPDRIRLVVHPGKNVADSLLDYCRVVKAGIVVLGHSKPGGTWGFLKSSITEKLISSAMNLSVWVNQ
ncbi:universal stress protein [Thermodesulforhabdus norvegica]|uniref:Nucleotide-binding universal stress protein, UspA family n=1 Tax=Thermodesulforhabdus norvegica TaxID=39841 RepID=A0A1I4VLA7_9BACT|nr:universal stress protein [Thermodesulforhabdus norvegica]SFN01933.1 Nucleotide-binding universal stress protein, UspA family [Thermodesulforhabdus norvegica]